MSGRRQRTRAVAAMVMAGGLTLVGSGEARADLPIGGYTCAGLPVTVLLNWGDDYSDTGDEPKVVLVTGAYTSVTTGDGDDVICDSGWSTFIDGRGGDDRIYAGGGDDRVYGGDGDDLILAGDGDDDVFGDRYGSTKGVGDDVIDGGRGADTIGGGRGSDTVTGGQGNDLLRVDDGIAQDSVAGGSGADTCYRDPGEDDSSCETLHVGLDQIGGG